MKLRLNNAAFWCRDEATFLRLKQIITDPERWPATYAEWLQRANEHFAETKKRGLVTTKINVDPDAFVAWCQINSRVADVRSRSLYATEELAKRCNRDN